MKKLSIIIILAFALVLALSSCNKKTCPAFSDVEMEEMYNNIG